MDAADMRKLSDALGTAIVNIDNYFSNFMKHGAAGGKGWAQWAAESGRDPAKAAEMKKCLALLSKMMKDGKAAQAGIKKLRKLADTKTMAKYPTGKDYRDLVVYKHLLPLDAWAKSAVQFKKTMNTFTGGLSPHPNFGNARFMNEIVTYNSTVELLDYYIVLQKKLDQV